MNTKFFFVLLVAAIVLSACAPAITSSSAPVISALQAVNADDPALVPVTGENAAAVRPSSSEPRLWSGVISLSDNNNPDRTLKLKVTKQQKPQSACMSEDSPPRRQSGCIE